jgi:hypothetical protein
LKKWRVPSGVERFDSSFMDKCVDPIHHNKKHCEPTAVCHSDVVKSTGENLENLVKELLIDPRVMFEACVDTPPLKWNMHFFPESLNCNGLLREIQNCEDFCADLQAMGQRCGGSVTQQTEDAFKVNLRGENVTRTAHLPSAHQEAKRERKAAKRLQAFYTPITLRRVSEHMPIDHVKVGLPISKWAEEMLQKEHAVAEKDGTHPTPKLLSASS